MSTYISFLEKLVGNDKYLEVDMNLIKSRWKYYTPKTNRVEIGKTIVKYFETYGRYHYDFRTNEGYYNFPFYSGKILKNTKKLKLLYKFFFGAKSVTVTTHYE